MNEKYCKMYKKTANSEVSVIWTRYGNLSGQGRNPSTSTNVCDFFGKSRQKLQSFIFS